MDSILVLVSDGGLVDGGRGSVVDRGWLVDGGSLVDGSSLVDGGSFVDGGSMVDRGWFVGGGLVSGGLRVLSFTGVGNIGDVTTVTISNVVGHSLKTAVGESHGVASLGRISITRLIGIEVGSTVVVIDSVLVSVGGGLLVGGLVVGRSSVGQGGDGASGGSGDTGEHDESLQ